ncbi:DUF805 domain-containing protein [Phenylobacterium sp.]|uniref:DUF805 domain-containing protein n=1 Tax=Phenylobacterium sp. TaxID=1871053 RepID=UPI0035AE1522
MGEKTTKVGAILAGVLAVGSVFAGSGAYAQTTASDDSGIIFAVGLTIAVCFALFLVPTFIAFRRHSRYRYIILILNLSVSFTGVGWLAIFILSIWPDNRQERPLVVNVQRYGEPDTASASERVVPSAPIAAGMVAKRPANPFTEFFGRYFDFGGRTARSTFWITTVVMTVVWFVMAVVLEGAKPGTDGAVGPLTVIWFLGTLLPWLSLSIRRLHDIGRSGWWQLLHCTGFGSFLLLYWYCRAGTVGSNRFGDDPLRHRTVEQAAAVIA